MRVLPFGQSQRVGRRTSVFVGRVQRDIQGGSRQGRAAALFGDERGLGPPRLVGTRGPSPSRGCEQWNSRLVEQARRLAARAETRPRWDRRRNRPALHDSLSARSSISSASGGQRHELRAALRHGRLRRRGGSMSGVPRSGRESGSADPIDLRAGREYAVPEALSMRTSRSSGGPPPRTRRELCPRLVRGTGPVAGATFRRAFRQRSRRTARRDTIRSCIRRTESCASSTIQVPVPRAPAFDERPARRRAAAGRGRSQTAAPRPRRGRSRRAAAASSRSRTALGRLGEGLEAYVEEAASTTFSGRAAAPISGRGYFVRKSRLRRGARAF